MSTRVLCAAMLCVASTVAFAQAAPQAPAQAGGPDAAFAAWDKDGNGALSKDEFRAGWTGARTALATQRLRVEFRRQDADASGKLEAAEYAKLALVQRAGKGAPLLSAFDKDKDQGLDVEEYLDFVRTSAKTQAKAPDGKAKGN